MSTDMAGDAEFDLRERVRQETLSMSTFVLASYVRHARRQVIDHPNEPYYRVKLDAYAAELRKRTGAEITDPPLPAAP